MGIEAKVGASTSPNVEKSGVQSHVKFCPLQTSRIVQEDYEVNQETQFLLNSSCSLQFKIILFLLHSDLLYTLSIVF